MSVRARRSSGPLNRRQFLEIVAGSAGLVAVAGAVPGMSPFGAAAAFGAAGGASGPSVQPRYSPHDGLLTNFVSGVVRDTAGGHLSIAAPASRAGMVSVVITAATEVSARARQLRGDASDCRSGDRIMVGTDLDEVGNRSARWVTINPVIIRTRVQSVSGNTFTGAVLNRDFTEQGTTVQVTIPSHANLGYPSMRHGQAIVGDILYITGTADSPQLPADSLWALGGGLVLLKSTAA